MHTAFHLSCLPKTVAFNPAHLHFHFHEYKAKDHKLKHVTRRRSTVHQHADSVSSTFCLFLIKQAIEKKQSAASAASQGPPMPVIGHVRPAVPNPATRHQLKPAAAVSVILYTSKPKFSKLLDWYKWSFTTKEPLELSSVGLPRLVANRGMTPNQTKLRSVLYAV